MVLQWPTEGAELRRAARNSSSSISPGRQLAPRAPDHRAGADQLALVPAVQHRPAGEHDGGDVDRRGRHDPGGRRLVAAGGQHHGVDRIAVQDLDQPEIREIAVERRRRPAAVLEDRMHREFHRHAARVANAVAHALHRFRDGRDCTGVRSPPVCAMPMIGLPLSSSSGGEAVVHEALEIERRPCRCGRGVGEPVARAEAASRRGEPMDQRPCADDALGTPGTSTRTRNNPPARGCSAALCRRDRPFQAVVM